MHSLPIPTLFLLLSSFVIPTLALPAPEASISRGSGYRACKGKGEGGQGGRPGYHGGYEGGNGNHSGIGNGNGNGVGSEMGKPTVSPGGGGDQATITLSSTADGPMPTPTNGNGSGNGNDGGEAPPPIVSSTVQPPPAESTPPPPPPPPEPTTVPPPANDGGPVGLTVNSASNIDGTTFQGADWYYSWGIDPQPGTEGLEFVPMLWTKSDADKFDPAKLNGAKHVLGFNEPDITGNGGSGQTVSDAATGHKTWSSKVPADVKVGSIAVARGGKSYFDQWKAACGADCRYDFIPLHYYGMDSAGFINYMKTWADEGKPLWVTEFACREYRDGNMVHCTPTQAEAFMRETIGWMRGQGKNLVERWAYFGTVRELAETNDENALMGNDGKATEIGKLYVSL